MGCCGKKKQYVPKISPEQKKIIEKVKKVNFGAMKRGKTRITVNSRQCINCNTYVSNSVICPICGHKI